MKGLKKGGRTGGRKKEGSNNKGGTEIVHPLLVRGGQRSKNTLSNGWPPSSPFHFYTLGLERHVKNKIVIYFLLFFKLTSYFYATYKHVSQVKYIKHLCRTFFNILMQLCTNE